MRTFAYVNYYVLCLVCWILLGITGVSTRSHSIVKRYNGIYTGPFFDNDKPINISAQLGSPAFLPCKIRQLGNKSVSWIRRRDAHILSVDRTMFIPDERFQATYVESTETWNLQVKYVQARDEGQYECQISTEPKMSKIVNLNIVVPKIEIMGDHDMYVKTGSTVTLRCVIKQSVEVPLYVFWYHEGNRVLDYQPAVPVIETKHDDSQDTVVSKLIIQNAKKEDEGNYTCSPSNLHSASVQLHVLNGEHPAAIQRGQSSVPGCCGFLWWFVGAVTLYPCSCERSFLLFLTILSLVLVQNYVPSTEAIEIPR